MELLFLFLLIIFTTGTLTAFSQTDPVDAAAMRIFSEYLSPSSRSLGWSPTTDPCTWSGVTCTASRVTAVQLGNHSLTGQLPPDIRNLTALTRLELHHNSLNGPLPSLSGLSQLQTLLLHSNRFASIPPDFFNGLSGLQSVYLDDNPLDPWLFPASLTSATSLVNFSANYANVTGRIPNFIATAFPSLDHLGLAFNLLSGKLPASLAVSSVRSLWLNNQRLRAKLEGSLDVVQNMTALEELWLQSNSFTGPIPDLSELTNLRDLQLRDNQLTGPVPKSLTSMKSLNHVALTNNLLQGPVPVFPKSVTKVDLDVKGESFCLAGPGECDPRVGALLAVVEPFGYPVRFAGDWKGNDPCDEWVGITCDGSGNITVINFPNMGLTGTISPDFSLFPALQKLILSGNNLTGTIPASLAGLKSLRDLDVSNNLLSGKDPSFTGNVLVNTKGNPDFGKDIVSSPPTSPVSNGSPPIPRESIDVETHSGRKSSSVSPVVIVASVVGVICGVSLIGFLGFLFYKRKQQPLGRVQSPTTTTVVHPRHSGSDPDTVKITVAGSSLNGTSEANSPTSSGRPNDVHIVETGNMMISIQVLRNVTDNFSESNILGRGGFGTVYKGELHDGTKIAVKRMESGVMGNKGLNEFKSEIAVLTKVRHRNLVSLLGYCLDGNERLLVYEYMPQGALSRHLFDWKEEVLKPLEWKKRLSIALDVARGVEYLHSLAHQSFIHRDLKPSNILLGDDMKAKVADFGLVRLAPDGKCCSIETRLAGTFGYLAPEYAVTGRVTTKADVFSFGVILMELITGRKALDESQPEESVHLVTWFRRMQVGGKESFRKAIDPAMGLVSEGDGDDEKLASVRTVGELAGHCCAREPYQRPDMGHAVNVLSSLAELWRPSDPDSDDSYGIDLEMTLPQALKKWQAFEDDATSSSSFFLASMDNTQTSIPTKPPGFADSFTSADGR